MAEIFDSQARELEKAAEALELAAAHLHHSAAHFRNREVPRATAHAMATRGFILGAERILDEWAMLHATKASL